MKDFNKTTICILYCLFIINYVLSESQLVNYGEIYICLFLSRYVIVGIVMLFAILKIANKKQKIENIMLCSIIIGLICINVLFFNGGARIVINIIMMAALVLYNVEIEKVTKLFICSLWGSCFFVFFLCFGGILSDITNVRYIGNNFLFFYDGNFLRHTFGFLVPNQMPLTLFFTYIYLLMQKKEKLLIKEHVLIVAINVLFLFLFGSRISFLLIMVIFCWALGFLLKEKQIFKIKTKIVLPPIMWISYPLCALLSFLLALCYDPSKYYLLKLNNILMNRLAFSSDAIEEFGVSIFGSGQSVSNAYTLDNGYINVLLINGYIVLIIILFIWTYYTYINEKKNNMHIAYLLGFLAVANLIDTHLISYKMIPVFIMMIYDYKNNISSKEN